MIFPILIPAAAALCIFLLPKADRWVKVIFALMATAATLALAILLCGQDELDFTSAWGGFGMDFSLRLYHFSAFIMLAASAFAFLISLYSSVFHEGQAACAASSAPSCC